MAGDLKGLSLEEIADKDIIELIGGESLSDEEKGLLYEKMLETIRMRTLDRLDQTLIDTERHKLKEILNSHNNDSSLQSFIHSKNFDMEKVMAEEALKYKAELVAHVDLLNKGSAAISQNLDK